MADSSTERRMFCLQLTAQLLSRVDGVISAGDIVEYSGTLEEYMKNGHSKLKLAE